MKFRKLILKHMKTVASVTLALAIIATSTVVMVHADTNAGSSEMAGTGTATNPYIVTTADQLQLINANPSSDYKLGNDIDLSSYGNWTPIGNASSKFVGDFDGDGHKITGLTIGTASNPITSDYLGLFGQAYGTIKNVSVSVSIYSSHSSTGYVGGLVGLLQGSVSNCTTAGTIETNQSPHVGGLVGELGPGLNNTRTNCTNCHSLVSVAGGDNVGGLIGDTNAYGYGPTISNCYSSGTVSGNDCVGGFIGTQNNSLINNCYSTGNLTGKNLNDAGGFAGVNYDGITNCYATGKISTAKSTGGFVGINAAYGSIVNCYSSSTIDISSNDESTDAGFAGYNDSEISKSYWNKTNNTIVTAGYYNGGYNKTTGKNPTSDITGMTTSDMQTKFLSDTLNSNIISLSLKNCSAWEYNASINGGYPYLDGVGVGIKPTDTTPPTGTYTLSPSSSTTGSVTINLTATDADSGVKSITLPDGSSVTTSTASYSVSKNGTYDFTVTDNAGNTAKITATVSNISVSPSGPVITANSALASDSKSATVTVKIADSNNISTIKWSSGSQTVSYFGSNGNAVSNTFDITDNGIKAGGTFNVSDNGTYTVYAKDSSGAETVNTIEVTGIGGNSDSDGKSKTDTVPISGTIDGSMINVTHPASIEYTIAKDGTFVSPDFPITNNSAGAVNVTVQSLKSVSGGTLQFSDVAPDAKDWSNLDLADSKQFIALGVRADTSTAWNSGVSTNTYWSINNSPSAIGSIAQNVTASLQLAAKNGHVFDQTYTAKHALILEFDLT